MTAPQLTAQIQGQGAVSADQLNTYQQTCDTASQLRAFIGIPGINVWINGIAAPGDGEAGNFRWVASGTGPDDNLNVIVPPGSATGCWVRTPPDIPYAMRSEYLPLSQYTTLQAATAAAALLSTGVLVDEDITLLQNTSLSGNVPLAFQPGCTIFTSNFTLTGNGNYIHSFRQKIFDISSTGTLAGSFYADEFMLEWLGAGPGSSAALNTKAVQLWLTIQNNAGTEVDITFAHGTWAYGAAQIVKPQSFLCPTLRAIGGQYDTIWTYNLDAVGDHLSFITYAGGSGRADEKPIMVGFSIQNLGTVVQYDLTNNGLCSCYPKQMTFTPTGIANYSYHLLNTTDGPFTEAASARQCDFGSGSVTYTKAAGGDSSFRGSGAIKCYFRESDTAVLSSVEIQTGCQPYLADFAGNQISKVTTLPFFNNQGSIFTSFVGDFRSEDFTEVAFNLASGNRVLFVGTRGHVGKGAQRGTLVQISQYITDSGGNTFFQPFPYTVTGSALSGTSTTIPFNLEAEQVVEVEIHISNGDASYDYRQTVSAQRFGATGGAVAIATRSNTDTHSYGVPAYTMIAGGNLQITNANFTSSFTLGDYGVTFKAAFGSSTTNLN